MKISELTKDDVGKWVVCHLSKGDELGKIKDWTHKYIYVVYKCAGDWNNFKNYTGVATPPEMLTFSKVKESTINEILYEGRDYDSSVKEVNGIEDE